MKKIFENITNKIKEINFPQLIWSNFWLKLISLGIAIVTWFYVYGELTRGVRV